MQHSHLDVKLIRDPLPMRNHPTNPAAWFLLLALALSGCAPTGTRNLSPSEADSKTDPTAIHLHHVAGQLLLYYATHQQLPQRLEDLSLPGKPDIPGSDPVSETPPAIDPATRRPYIYLPAGPLLPGANPDTPVARLVLYQSAPTNRIGRWALVMDARTAEGRLATFVQCLPEAVLRSALTRQPAPRE